MAFRRGLSVRRAASAVVFAAATLVFGIASPANAGTSGAQETAKCGNLSNGEVCIIGPDTGRTGTYRTEYCKSSGSGDVYVQLGYQIAYDGSDYSDLSARIMDSPLYGVWAGSCTSYSRHLNVSSDNCVRGIMKWQDYTYISKWHC
ncbi:MULTISPECIES: hypothetical protein [Streptomyces]|uniref:hypothetical protein n=1 Tax=Streptomyces TaxID=1883 RepID=UPI0031E8DC1F